MLIIEVFACLILLIICLCREQRVDYVNKKKHGLLAFPTGYAIEYDVTVKTYNALNDKYNQQKQMFGYDYATKQLEIEYGSYQLGNQTNLLLCYAIIKGREAAIAQNKMPKCYSDRTMDGVIDEYAVSFGYKKYRSDKTPVAYYVDSRRGNKIEYSQQKYQKLLDIDKRTYDIAIDIRKKCGAWTGEFERRFTL